MITVIGFIFQDSQMNRKFKQNKKYFVTFFITVTFINTCFVYYVF